MQAARCIQDHRSELRIRLINSDIFSSNNLPGILQNCRSVKHAAGNSQDRMKTDSNITISCNDVGESKCKPEIAGLTSEIIELISIGNVAVLAL